MSGVDLLGCWILEDAQTHTRIFIFIFNRGHHHHVRMSTRLGGFETAGHTLPLLPPHCTYGVHPEFIDSGCVLLELIGIDVHDCLIFRSDAHLDVDSSIKSCQMPFQVSSRLACLC